MKTLINRFLPLIVSLVLLTAMSAQAQVNYDKITYIHSDASGTPIAASDEQGDIVWIVDHYPYGAEYSNDANNRAGTLSFAGKAYDEETGLSYFGGRWYNAHVGRFMGIDPVGVDPEDWRTFNRYSYGFNNPYKYVDPDGNFPILAAAAIVGGLNVLGLYLETRYDAANPCSDCVRSSGGIDIGLSAGLAKAGSAIGSKLASQSTTNSGARTLFHYTDDAGLDGILSSKKLNPSLKANNQKDARFGNGQYLSDIAPGTRTGSELSHDFLGIPFQGGKFKNFVEIDVSGLNTVKGREGIFVIPNNSALDISKRIVSSGSN